MSTGERHASFREVADLVDGILTGARRDRVEAHVATGCKPCARAIDATRGLVATLVAGPLPAPPAAAGRRATALFGATWRRAVAGRVHEVLATLLIDQRLAPAAALRGAPGTGRRLLWTVPGAELVVSISENRSRSDLLGQVLPDDDDGDAVPAGSIEVLRDGATVARAALDAEGGFATRGLVPGTYVLRGRVEGAPFRTPPFVVG